MKRFALVPAVFALVAMVAACTEVTAPDASGPLFRHGGDHVVPIKGDFAYSPTGNTPVTCTGDGFEAQDVSGPGKASHLGETAFALTVVSCYVGQSTLTLNGLTTLTGANGDAIFVTSTSVFDLAGQFGAFTTTGTITGGTGSRPG